MIFDRDHPRTILHNIERSWNFLQRIRPVRGARYPSARLISGLHQELLQASIDEVLARGVGRFLESLVGALDLVGEAIRRDFFYAPVETPELPEGAPMLQYQESKRS